jgi:sporulation protein YlmC with PRC-barrel domain
MRLRLGQHVEATDGPFGEVGDIVIDPITRSVAHLVVEPHHRHQQARLVPITLVEVEGDTVLVEVDRDRLRRFEQVAEVDYVRLGLPIELGPEWDVGTQRVLAPIGYGEAYGMWSLSDYTSLAFDRIPRADCEIRALSSVRTSDGHQVGTVEGFLTDDERVSVFGSDHPPSTLNRLEHRAGRTAHLLTNSVAGRWRRRGQDRSPEATGR